MTNLLLAIIYMAFISLGLPDALLGAAAGGVTGLWLAVPAAELLTLIAGLLLVRRKSR